MTWLFRKRRSERALASRLRTYRPRPRPEFVAELSRAVAPQPRRQPYAARVAFALAFSVFVIGGLASFGGLTYAATGAGETMAAVERLVTQKPLARTDSAAADQYKPKPKPKPKANALPAALPAEQRSGVLPFTGVSLAVTMLLGLLLVAAGIVLRRRESR